jgi:hypothetical protein
MTLAIKCNKELDGILLKSDFDEEIAYFLLPSIVGLSQDSRRFKAMPVL